ncbi:MAG: hypothetical protein WDM87_05500 [Terracidiphilus sp.]
MSGPAQWLFTERVETHGAHVIEQDFELASAVAGDALAAVGPLIPVDLDAESWCAMWLATTFSGTVRPIALITPGAGMGSQAMATGALRRCRRWTHRARFSRRGQRRTW